MRRREFVKTVGLGALTTIGLSTRTVAARAKAATASYHKQWAKEHYKGMENLLFPSYTPDFKTLDEEGIRNDVRNSIRNGFFSSMPMPVGVSTEEHKQFIKIACDEAKGKILIGGLIAEKTSDGDMDMLAYTQKIGCTHLLVTPDRNFRAKTEEELYQGYLRRISATHLPVVLYAPVAEYYREFGPNGVPLGVFDRLADLPNVIAVKTSQPLNLTTVFQICEVLGNRLLVGPVNLDFVPVLAKHYRVQWSGQWNVEAVQSPEKPYAVEMMRLLNYRRFDEALKVYAELEPALDAFFRLQAPYILKGVHPWSHNKYFQWCVGGNGGLVRKLNNNPDYVPDLDPAGRQLIKETFQRVGITPVTAPEEEFVVGKAAYARGIRLKDMTDTPYYG
jgi:4-hydroxy-tetrahydrodipicolinate synthase